MIQMLDIIAYDLLARDDIVDLRATRDAIELADLLINTASYDHLMLMIDAGADLDDAIIDELRAIMTDMILNPID
jgi:hypothetical protein